MALKPFHPIDPRNLPRWPQPNPNDTISEFAEVCRKGRVDVLHADGEWRQRAVGGDWVDLLVPVFDFGFSGVESKFIQAGVDLLNDGGMMLPYPRCIYLQRGLDDNLGDHFNLSRAPEIEWLYSIAEQEDGIRVVMFHRGLVGSAFNRRWTLFPALFVAGYGEDANTIYFDRECDAAIRDGHVDRQDLADRCDMHSLMVFGLTCKLGMRGVETPEAEPTPRSRAVNAGRESAGLRPLPLVRRVDGSRVVLPEVPTKAPGTGRSPRPHWRRGHFRTLKDGRVVPIPSVAVKGGGGPMPTYRVD
ncbi:hypothetical protein [Siccirubricoccus deserti]|uniref:Uncharacterized protein n=1 Tax=Siccirubricoccus deserti TaxID=2013562 RepID=A0A9X0R5A5_9PROT|nr:hypothetical protein [Siccirubricoccus deserti]MBC4018647.1 hypothetical protein [Siccirubricoccus deserti]